MNTRGFDRTALVAGLFFVAAGILFLLDQIEVIDLQLTYVGPILLIVLGIAVLVGSLRRRRGPEGATQTYPWTRNRPAPIPPPPEPVSPPPPPFAPTRPLPAAGDEGADVEVYEGEAATLESESPAREGEPGDTKDVEPPERTDTPGT
jgi:hypothetical protein